MSQLLSIILENPKLYTKNVNENYTQMKHAILSQRGKKERMEIVRKERREQTKKGWEKEG